MRRKVGLVTAVVVAGLLAMPSPVLGGTIDFSLMPADGAVSGPPGSTVGWGYSFTNNSLTDWFMPILLNADSFANGTPNLIFDFPNVAPGVNVPVPFDSLTGVGLYELVWDIGAPVGFVNSGNFVLSGQWWDGDPLNGGNFLFSEPDISLPYAATVIDGGAPSVPEPSTWSLCLGALAAVVCLRLVRKRSRVPASGR
jgi:hypothetical protein